MFGGAIRTAVPVSAHVLIRPANEAAAIACVAGIVPASVANPTGPGGGAPVQPAAAIPAPTEVAQAVKAVSICAAAAGCAKAVARAVASVAEAAATVVDAGTTAEA